MPSTVNTRNVMITQVPMPASTAMVHQADGGAEIVVGKRLGDQP